MRKKIRKAGLAAAVCFISAVSGFVSGCSGAQTSPETGQESEEQEAPAGETGAEENAQVVDQSTESVSRYAGVYKARRDMRKALNLTLPGGTDLVRTKVKLTYVLTLREDGSFDIIIDPLTVTYDGEALCELLSLECEKGSVYMIRADIRLPDLSPACRGQGTFLHRKHQPDDRSQSDRRSGL